MGNIHALAGAPHPITLDRLGENNRGLPMMVHRCVVRRIDFDRIMSAAPQLPDLLIIHVRDRISISSGYFEKNSLRTYAPSRALKA